MKREILSFDPIWVSFRIQIKIQGTQRLKRTLPKDKYELSFKDTHKSFIIYANLIVNQIRVIGLCSNFFERDDKSLLKFMKSERLLQHLILSEYVSCLSLILSIKKIPGKSHWKIKMKRAWLRQILNQNLDLLGWIQTAPFALSAFQPRAGDLCPWWTWAFWPFSPPLWLDTWIFFQPRLNIFFHEARAWRLKKAFTLLALLKSHTWNRFGTWKPSRLLNLLLESELPSNYKNFFPGSFWTLWLLRHFCALTRQKTYKASFLLCVKFQVHP